MKTLVKQNQSNFIPSRNISDNIIIAQEAIHTIKTMRSKKGWMVVKVDLETAYDKIHWDFIWDTTLDSKLSGMVMDSIMQCVLASSMQLVWNGILLEDFFPSRGVRQGDPLSPYLFVLGWKSWDI